MKPFLLSVPVFLALSIGLWAAEPVDYLRDIKPILTKSCQECHGPQKQRGGLRLDTAALLRAGGNGGPAFVPGKSSGSRLIQAVVGGDGVKIMPPREPRLTPAQIALLKSWIDQGAPAPANEVAAKSASKSSHWAFQLPVRHVLPAVRDQGWVRNPIDGFVLARLEKEAIRPSPEADRATLLRRLSLDLTGLPPSSEELDRFLADPRPDAYERLVDRLLASPHYGERWARHWLDQARYADSNGFNIDAPRTIWPYRDWVIGALNHDMPFDQFTIEQLAGDLLPPVPPEDKAEHAWKRALDRKIATGFHRNTLINQEGGIDLEQFRVESVVDRVNTTGAVFLGLTVGCGQCHDHKYDPFSQRDYFQLFAFLNNADEPNLDIAPPDVLEKRNRIRSEIARLEKRLQSFDRLTRARLLVWEKKLAPEELASLPAEIQEILALVENARSARQDQLVLAYFQNYDLARHALGGLGSPLPVLSLAHAQMAEDRRQVQRRIADLKQAEPQVLTTMVMQERASPRETYIHLGGDFLRQGARVTPGVPAALHPLKSPSTLPNRLDLARWLVDPENPLTPRVIMNRSWQQFFGVGLVETENDFGTQGTPPTHPELLDWLATEFIARKWSLKAMHRLIVTSATYRQASRSRPDLAVKDPRNRLLARQARVRLEAEVIRDAALAASGLLSCKIGGPGVFPPQPDGVYRFTQIQRDWRPHTGPDRYRRGMYTYFWRSAPFPALTVFDAPDSTTACTRRNRSNTPLQALTLLNDEASYEFAQGLARRILVESRTTDTDRLRYAVQLCLGRPPTEFEQKRLHQLLLLQPESVAANSPLAAWTTVARVLLNLDEFITRE